MKKERKEIQSPIPRERPILFGFATKSKSMSGRLIISFRWARIFGALVGGAFLVWLGLAGALYAHFKYNRDFDEASYTKMLFLLPTIPFGGLEKHRVKMGDYHIEKGLDEIRQGNFRDALRLLRHGVGRSPANLEGRAVLAELYEVALKRTAIAADQLIQGIKRGGIDDLDYLKQTLRVLLRNQMDDEIQEIADTYLPEVAELTDRNRTIAFGAANANFLRGNYDRADDYLIDYNLVESLEGLLLSSRISWDRGNQYAAISKLERSLNKFPNSETLLMQLSRFHREMDNLDDARRYAILRNLSDPLSPAPRLELLYIYNKTGNLEREKLETQRMLQQFREDEAALQALANFAANTGNIDLARRTYEEALENEFAVDAFALLLVEAHLVSEDHDGALEFAEELLKERPEWLAKRWAIFASLRSVASFGINRGDLGEIYLQDFIDEAGDQPQTFLAVARRFNNIERFQQARRVLIEALQKAPNNQKVLTELIKAELRLGFTENLDRLLSRLLQMRRPQPELLAEAYDKLGSDRFIFTPGRESLLLQIGALVRERTQVEAL